MPLIASKKPGRFAIVGPPSDAKHLYSVIDWYRHGQPKRFSNRLTLLKLLEWLPPFKGAEFPELVSNAGVRVSGLHVWCPIMPEMVTTMDSNEHFKLHVKRRVFEACRVAGEEGATIVALGAFSSIAVVGSEERITTECGVGVTSGNAYTAALTLAGVKRAADAVGLDLEASSVAILGASGDIGRAVSRALAGTVRRLTLTARNLDRLHAFARELDGGWRTAICATGDNSLAAVQADIIIGTAISPQPLIGSDDVSPGTIVCDVGFPKNMTGQLEQRPDVFTFCGGLARPPFLLNFGYETNLPAKDVLYGCLSEAIILSLEGSNQNFSTGRGGITESDMQDITEAGRKHGFELAPFMAGHRLVGPDQIARVSEARRARFARRRSPAHAADGLGTRS